MSDLVADSRIDAFNARLELDASAKMRELVPECFQLLQRFAVSHAMKVPVKVDEDGLFDYRWDLVAEGSDASRQLQMRLALGEISQTYEVALDKVTAQVRREVHAAK